MLEEFKQINKIVFETEYCGNDYSIGVKELNAYLSKLSQCFEKDQKNFAEICYYVYKVKELFSDYSKTLYGGFSSKGGSIRYTFNRIMQNLGIDETQSSRLISCYEKFVTKDTDKPLIFAEFHDFSKSKLIELIPVPDEQLKLDIHNKVLRSDMSVKTIREYVKNYKVQQKQNKRLTESKEKVEETINEEDIPMAYNPQQHYDFDYFQEKNKAQLLNIVWELQKEYEKLKTSYNKLKKEKK